MNAMLIKYLTAAASSMTGVIAFSVLFRAPKSEYLYCGIAGTIGWMFYLLVQDLGGNDFFANFIGTFILTLFCRLMAVVRQNPVTVYLVTGIFPLVPGAGIFYTAYYFVMGFPDTGMQRGLNIIEVAGAITLGIVFGSFLMTGLLHVAYRKRGSQSTHPEKE